MVKIIVKGLLEIITTCLIIGGQNKLTEKESQQKWSIYGAIIYLFGAIYNPFNPSYIISGNAPDLSPQILTIT